MMVGLRPKTVVETSQNITGPKKARQALIESERRLLQIINFLPDPTFAIDLDGRVISWNLAIEEMTGVRAEDILGKGNYEYALPFYGKRTPILIDLVTGPEKEAEIKTKYRTINKKVGTLTGETATPLVVNEEKIYLWTKASPIYDQEGKISGAIETMRDITCAKRTEEGLKRAYDDVEKIVKGRTADLAQANQTLDREIQQRIRSESALRFSQKRYRNIFKNIPVALLEIDFSEVIKAVNDLKYRGIGHFRRFFEQNPELVTKALKVAKVQNVNPFAIKFFSADSKQELLGSLDKIFTKNSYQMFQESLVSIAEGKTFCEYESVSRSLKDGEVYVLVRHMIPNKEEGFNNLMVSLLDLTERKKIENSLKESEQRLNDIIDFLPDATFAIDTNGKVIAWNLAIEEMTGIAAKHMVGKKNYEYALPFYGIRMPLLVDLAIRPDEEIEKDYSLLKKEKDILLAESQVSVKGNNGVISEKARPLYDIKGNIAGAIESIRDITLRKQAEEVLQKSEKSFRDLLENSPVGICIIQDRRVVYMNSEQKRIIGTVPDSFQFKNLNVHPEDSKNFIQFCDSVFSYDVPIDDMQIRFYPFVKNGKPTYLKWVNLRASLTEYHKRRAVLINMIDVTKTKGLEKAIQLREKMASLGHVAAGMAHEIRNPLSGINLLLDIIKESLEPSENAQDIKGLVSQAQEAANKIESVIKRVLDFSRPNEPHLTLENINVPIKEAMELSRTVLRKSGINIQSSLDQNMPKLYIDVQLIEQLILNLINNAAEAMKNKKDQKILKISSAQENKDIVLKISDSGTGIPVEIRDKIFDPFFTTKSDGSGIGLSLCQRIIADHGGTIKVVCSKLGGAEFRIRIPIEKRRFCE
jgi:PAS domain S-box-containing protein